MKSIKQHFTFLFFLLAIIFVAGIHYTLAAPQASTRYVDPNGVDNGDCTNSAEPCQTIDYARQQSGATDTIQLSAGTFHENVSFFTDLDIVGAGTKETVVDGGQNGRVFYIINGVVRIADLTIQNGVDSGVNNNAHLTLDNVIVQHNYAGGSGGGIYNGNTAVLTMTQTTVYSNTASSGAGLINFGTTTITASTFYDNLVTGLNSGGGVENVGGATMNLENVTISGNTAGAGGGIANNGTLNLQNVTVADNRSTNNFGSGISNGGIINFQSSIVANNPGTAQCKGEGAGTFNSLGYNLENTNSCGFNQAGDLPSTSAQLRPLGNYGGPTFTHMLQPNSSAIDAGTNSICLASDQRGTSRPIDGNNISGAVCDIGAVEYNPATDLPKLFLPMIIR